MHKQVDVISSHRWLHSIYAALELNICNFKEKQILNYENYIVTLNSNRKFIKTGD